MKISTRHKIAAQVQKAPAAMAKDNIKVTEESEEDQFANAMSAKIAADSKRLSRSARLNKI